jgi:hypothetical protein
MKRIVLFAFLFVATSLWAQSGAPVNPSPQNLAAAGTTLAVRMIEPVDSNRPSGGNQYRGMVVKAVDGGNGITIPAGSIAIVALTKSQSGWAAQLQSVTVKRQTLAVSSGPASLTNSAQSMAGGAVNRVTSALDGFGFGRKKPAAPSAVQAIASGDRVLLPPGTQLEFVVSGIYAAGSGGAAMNGGGHPGPNAPNSGNSASPTSNSLAGLPALTANVTETLLGPRNTQFVVSPDGGHYATKAMHGSREVMVIDGVDGPEFDHATYNQFGGNTLDVVFSEDGKHSAYVAQRGDDLIMVRDNKEAFVVANLSEKIPQNPNPKWSLGQINQSHIHFSDVGGGPKLESHQCIISPGGAHVAVITIESRLSTVYTYITLDGVKSPPYFGMGGIDSLQVAFVGEKLVYAAQTTDQKWHMVVNDKPGPAYGSVRSLFLSQDNKHYAFVAQNGSGDVVVADGVPGTTRPHAGNGVQYLNFASNGRLGYLLGKPSGFGGTQVLIVDDKEISGEVQAVTGITPVDRLTQATQYVIFSPDGKRFGYVKNVPGGIAAVIDGKAGRAYNQVSQIQFSPDSKHVAYIGVRNLNFLVVDGQEMPGTYMRGFVFSDVGGRYGYQSHGSDGEHMVIDGKESPPYYNLVENSLTFSPDGQHYAYGASPKIGEKMQVVVDGTITEGNSAQLFSSRGQPRLTFPGLIYSPDGTRLAFTKAFGPGTSWLINGEELGRGSMWEFPMFSPTSKHFAVMTWTASAASVIADGKVGPIYQDLIDVQPNCVRFEGPNTVRFLGIKDGKVYRVTVDLGG